MTTPTTTSMVPRYVALLAQAALAGALTTGAVAFFKQTGKVGPMMPIPQAMSLIAAALGGGLLGHVAYVKLVKADKPEDESTWLQRGKRAACCGLPSLIATVTIATLISRNGSVQNFFASAGGGTAGSVPLAVMAGGASLGVAGGTALVSPLPCPVLEAGIEEEMKTLTKTMKAELDNAGVQANIAELKSNYEGATDKDVDEDKVKKDVIHTAITTHSESLDKSVKRAKELEKVAGEATLTEDQKKTLAELQKVTKDMSTHQEKVNNVLNMVKEKIKPTGD